MMLINRSLPVAILPLVVLLIQITFISSLPSISFPPQRRTLGFVDHLIRVNPLRALSNYFGRKFSANLYYPPLLPPRQQLPLQPQPQQIFYVPGTPTSQATHYVKLPVYHGQNVAMMLPQVKLAPVAPQFNIVTLPHYPQVQQPPTQQQYFLHGISYPVSVSPINHRFIPQSQPQAILQPAVSSYQTAGISYATRVQQVQPQHQPQAPITFIPQTSILVDEQHKVQHDLQYPYSLASNLHVQSSPTKAVENSFGTLPTLVNSANGLNDNFDSSGLSPPVPPNVQIDGFEDASSSGDMLKIFVIRPKDMERLKSSTESERNELAKEYSMKYFDLEQGAQELVLGSEEAKDNQNEVDLHTQKDETCIEPLCDPFLQKFIPQLLKSTINGQEEDDPIIIVKNNSHITTFNEDPFLQNHRLVDLDVSQDPNEDDEPRYTVMKAVEGAEGHSTDEILGQHSTLKPQRVKVHFPRKKLLSAKISSAELRRKQSQSQTSSSTGKLNEMQLSDISSSNSKNTNVDNISREDSMIPRPRNLKIDDVTYPRYIYRVARSRRQTKDNSS